MFYISGEGGGGGKYLETNIKCNRLLHLNTFALKGHLRLKAESFQFYILWVVFMTSRGEHNL